MHRSILNDSMENSGQALFAKDFRFEKKTKLFLAHIP